MGKAVFDKTSKLLREWSRWQVPANDPAIEVVVDAIAPPDRRTKRWDGGTGVRDATQAELDQYDADELDDAAQGDADDKPKKALGLAVHDELLSIAAQVAGYAAPTASEWRQKVVDKRKSLG